MFEKAKKLFVIWIVVVAAYIGLGFTMSVHNTIVADADAQFATQNLTGQFGIKEAVDSSPFWIWFIPGTVGVVVSVIIVKTDPDQQG